MRRSTVLPGFLHLKPSFIRLCPVKGMFEAETFKLLNRTQVRNNNLYCCPFSTHTRHKRFMKHTLHLLYMVSLMYSIVYFILIPTKLIYKPLIRQNLQLKNNSGLKETFAIFLPNCILFLLQFNFLIKVMLQNVSVVMSVYIQFVLCVSTCN